MSAILGVFSAKGTSADEAVIRRMLASMASRGRTNVEIWRDADAALAVARAEWELERGFSGPVLVLTEGDVTVVADASLYYRADLENALRERGVRASGSTPSHLIAAAYRAWGAGCADRLEGDFAFILWDRVAKRLLCSRDFTGKRPLYYAEFDGMVVVASTVGGILAHPCCPADLNLGAIGSMAAGLYATSYETSYRAIRMLGGGRSLLWNGGTPKEVRHWEPPQFHDEGDGIPIEQAAESLRERLCRAVAERLDPQQPSSIWLSGGWDSPAVYAAGESVLAARERGDHLRAVCISYPKGDPGREDELIELITRRWDSPVHWLDIKAIPLLDRPEARAAERDEPFSHAFENWNRALAAGSRAVETRVALDGNGGDQLFQVSRVYLADLLRQGRWIDLRREWKATGSAGTGWRSFFRQAVQPSLPSWLRHLAGVLRNGAPLRSTLERPLPLWMNPEFVRRYELVERERDGTPPRLTQSHAEYESSWYLNHPYFPRAFGMVSTFALEAGVETRSPLLDRRVVELAASRPREERASGRESKLLLRQAVRGLLPDSFLAPRPFKTGITSGYFRGSLRQTYAQWITDLVRSPLRLAELGMINPEVLQQQWLLYQRNSTGPEVGVTLLLTLQTELWLRARFAGAEELASGRSSNSGNPTTLAAR